MVSGVIAHSICSGDPCVLFDGKSLPSFGTNAERELSRAMRQINAMYTRHYNYLRKTDGLLFRCLYKAINIEESSYLLSLSRYIHKNTLETVKLMVRALADYRWSSYPAYLSEPACPDWLYKGAVYSELGAGRSIQAYRRFAETGVDKDTGDFYKKGVGPQSEVVKHFRKRRTYIPMSLAQR